MLAQLQSTNVGDNGPAVPRWYLRGVVLHRAKALGNHIEVIANWRLAQPIEVEGRRTAKSAAYDHTVAGAEAIVARRAVNIVALLSTRQHRTCHREREGVHKRCPRLTGVQRRIIPELPARHRARHERPCRLAVRKKRTGGEGVVAWLIGHLLTTTRRQQDAEQSCRDPQAVHVQTAKSKHMTLVHSATQSFRSVILSAAKNPSTTLRTGLTARPFAEFILSVAEGLRVTDLLCQSFAI